MWHIGRSWNSLHNETECRRCPACYTRHRWCSDVSRQSAHYPPQLDRTASDNRPDSSSDDRNPNSLPLSSPASGSIRNVLFRTAFPRGLHRHLEMNNISTVIIVLHIFTDQGDVSFGRYWNNCTKTENDSWKPQLQLMMNKCRKTRENPPITAKTESAVSDNSYSDARPIHSTAQARLKFS